jgi:hypothetical protein
MATTQERMVNILPFYLRNGENINKYYTALSEMFDEIIEVFVQIINSRDIDKAFGFGLDIIGDIVGESRNNLDDETYRENLRTKIRRNRSNGDIEVLNEFARSLLDSDFIGFDDDYTKSAELSFQYNFPRENPTIKDPVTLIKKIMAVGVRLKTELEFSSDDQKYIGTTTMQSNNLTIKTQAIDDNVGLHGNLYTGNSTMQSNKIFIKTQAMDANIDLDGKSYLGSATMQSSKITISMEV